MTHIYMLTVVAVLMAGAAFGGCYFMAMDGWFEESPWKAIVFFIVAALAIALAVCSLCFIVMSVATVAKSLS